MEDPFIAAWFVMEHAGTMDDLGVSPFQETSTCWWLNHLSHMYPYIYILIHMYLSELEP